MSSGSSSHVPIRDEGESVEALAPSASRGRGWILERAYESLNTHDFEGFSQLLDPQVILIEPQLGNPVGRAAIVDAQRSFISAFPDAHHVVEEVIEQGERTAARMTITGTHAGAWDGHDATGRRVRLAICVVTEWSADRVVTWQSYWDQLGLLEQLGVA